MDITPLIKQGQKIVQSYANGRFKISSVAYEHAVFVFPDAVHEWHFQGGFDDLTLDDFTLLIEKSGELDVILLGCGPKMRFLPPALQNALKNNGLSIDIMDTGAACRTYNVLLAEGRRVVAALLPS